MERDLDAHHPFAPPFGFQIQRARLEKIVERN
jgi:hypothetical protein